MIRTALFGLAFVLAATSAVLAYLRTVPLKE